MNFAGEQLRETYARARVDGVGRLHESSHSHLTNEKELACQARLYAGDLGDHWQGEDGEQIEVVHFGIWNREPGPDFIGAEVRIDGKTCRGDIELDRENADWERHGHAENPAFENVILHLCLKKASRRFFTRTTSHRQVSQAHLSPAESRRVSPTTENSEKLSAAEATMLIEAAARYRLGHKRERWLRAERLHGREDALFQALATAMGYKNNKVPFLLVAQRCGLSRLRGAEKEALLFGLAGFLQAERFEKCDESGRIYLRQLWDFWWKMREAEARLILPISAWNFSALRPANHPHRRMGALAACLEHFPVLSAAIRDASPEKFLKCFGQLQHPFWTWHWNVFGEKLPKEVALIGSERINDLLLNVFLPTLPPEQAWDRLANLKAPSLSTKEKRALTWLVDTEADIPPSALRQQGLLQLHDDFYPMSPQAVRRLLKHSR